MKKVSQQRLNDIAREMAQANGWRYEGIRWHTLADEGMLWFTDADGAIFLNLKGLDLEKGEKYLRNHLETEKALYSFLPGTTVRVYARK